MSTQGNAINLDECRRPDGCLHKHRAAGSVGVGSSNGDLCTGPQDCKHFLGSGGHSAIFTAGMLWQGCGGSGGGSLTPQPEQNQGGGAGLSYASVSPTQIPARTAEKSVTVSIGYNGSCIVLGPLFIPKGARTINMVLTLPDSLREPEVVISTLNEKGEVLS